MGFLLSGINHTTAPVELRERLSFDRESATRAEAELLHSGLLKEVVLLSTCNRTEIYGVFRDNTNLNGQIPRLLASLKGIPATRAHEHFYQKLDEDAIIHLFRVVSGLDSMVLGETQILGQVKDAYLRANRAGHTGAHLNKLFHHAFRTGKRVRTETNIGKGAVSVGSVAVDLAKKIFKDFRDKTVAVLGAGEMAVQTVQHLASSGAGRILVINRTQSKAEELAENVGGEVLPFARLVDGLLIADTVIVSTGAQSALWDAGFFQEIMTLRKNRPLFVIDISVPRNVAPEARNVYNLFLFDIDDLKGVISKNLAERRKEIPRAAAIIEEEIREFQKWYESVPAIELIQQLMEHFENIRKAEVKRYRKYFAREDWEQLDKFSSSLLKKFLHNPIVRLRTCPERDGLCDRCSVTEFFGLEVECGRKS